jgi:carbamoyl-phosphate synthase small subunit
MAYINKQEAVIILEDGAIFYGKCIGAGGKASGEICFNTGTTGYQEIFTDPSYFGQIMVTTNAHIGNYGVTLDEAESGGITISALICKNFSEGFSRSRADGDLLTYLSEKNLVVVTDVDTRALVAYIRDNGAQNAIVSTDVDHIENLKRELITVPSMKGQELASKVSCTEPYFYGDPLSEFKIAAIDLGIKRNILKNLSSLGMYVKVFPYNTSFEELKAFSPDGYFISNGPGDPEPLVEVINTARKIINDGEPLFGICLGHQIIALANDISTFKMHNGHRGINHPVKNLVTGKGEITPQNHGFAINREETEKNNNIEITHLHLNDGTVAGIRLKNRPCFSVQYHPEAGPGPNDATYLFDQFLNLIKSTKEAKS